MKLSAYQYASARQPHEGLRIGTARSVPRGVRREDWQRLGYFDLWVPLLAPPPELVEKFRHGKITFANFSRHYRSEMKKKESSQVIELLAGIALFFPISIGCFCEDDTNCHRSVLKELIVQAAKAKQAGFVALPKSTDLMKFASPVCFADWEEEV